jgi:glycosyltransferase involved in cell wall biosynthesis
MTRAATALDSPVALSSLQPNLETGWPSGVSWATDTGVGPDSLDIPIGHTARFRLRSFGGAHFRSHLSLDGPGRARSAGFAKAQVLLRGKEGSARLWSGLIGLGIPRAVEVAFPAWHGEAELLLSVSAPSLGAASPAHSVRWSQPVLEPEAVPTPVRPADTPAVLATADRPLPPAPTRPLVSILTPVHNPPPRILEEMLASVRAQSFDDWELLLVDDASTDPTVIGILDRVAAEDPRIRLERRREGGGISAATNTGLGSAEGTYIALLDHDDVLDPDALAHVAAKIANDPGIDMLYSDEDIFDGHRRLALFRKPNWSPDLLRSHMYTCHFGVYRRSLAEEIGGFRSEFDGSQDHDFVLRLSERTDRDHIVHIPRVLYHWRSHAESAADNPIAKPQTAIAGRRAIADQLERNGIEATTNFSALRSWYRVDYPFPKTGSTAVVLSLGGLGQADLDQLPDAAGTWLRGTEGDAKFVVSGTTDQLALVVSGLENALGDRVEAVTVAADDGRAAGVNRAVDALSAERLVLLDGPVEALTSNWIGRLSSFAAQDGVGLVGAKILAADGRVESAGIALRDGLPAPVGFGFGPAEFGPLALLQVSGNFCAVADAVAITREDFQGLGGLDEDLGELAIIDLSLRAWCRGQRVVGTPDAVLRRLPGHGGPVNDLGALVRFRDRWAAEVPTDPYFNPILAAVLTGRIAP